ncbi:MAG: DUF6607 family protein [Candidatus Rokuibacteriota bacterium]
MLIRAMLLTLLMLPAGAPLAHAPVAQAEEGQLARGRAAVQSMAGCYLVDYSYVEVESLKPGYVRDPRVYDVNRDKSAKEWITALALSPGRVRLQRILFLSDLAGNVREDTQIKHQSEDWEYDAPYLYDFVAPLTWQVRDLRGTSGLWTRRVTNLDDGLRYQCAARWSEDRAYPEWSCSNYAPIPGRETRDMGRSDYQTLRRGTRIVLYGAAEGGSWLERQDNVKTIHLDSSPVPLVRELGKNWYVRLPDAECVGARAFAERRRAYWALLRETWDGVLDGSGPFVERPPAGRPPRFVRMFEVEDDAITRDLSDPAVRQGIRERILSVIEEYRVR